MNLLSILFQVDAVSVEEGTGIFQKLADQALSLALLACVAYFFFRRMRELEDRIDKYQSEDRDKMLEVIRNNSSMVEANNKLFERLEHLIDGKIMHNIVTLFVFTSLFISGCGKLKKVTSSMELKQDTSTTALVVQTNSQMDKLLTIEKRDSTIGIAAQKVSDTAKGVVADVPVNKHQEKLVQHFRKKVNGLEAWANIDTNGRLTYGAQSDSITLVVQNLLRVNQVLSHRYDSLLWSQQSNKSQVVSKTTSDTVKVQSWLQSNWWIIPVVVVIVLLGLFLNVLKKYLGW